MDPTGTLPHPDPPADGLTEARADRLRYQESFEFAPDSQFVTDGHGVILEANHAAVALLRCRKEFLAGKPLGLFVTPGNRTRFYDSLTRLWGAGAGSGAADAFESRVARRGSDPRDVFVWASADATGPRAYCVFRWQFRDVTVLKQAEAARADLLGRLVTAQEEERRRIARELHDSLGQYLAAMSFGLQAVRAEVTGPAADRLGRLADLSKEIGQEVHRLALELRPTSLDDIGLQAALENYVEQWAERAHVPVDFDGRGLDPTELPWELATAIYRVVQEALTNILKHAGATRVSVILDRRSDHLLAIVEDDGRGFDPDALLAARPQGGGLGLIGMRERIAVFGGAVQIESSSGAGTTVFVRVPLPHTGAHP